MSDGTREVDPWRFAGGFLEKVLSARIPERPAHADIPWSPFTGPLSAARVSLVTTAGISMRGDAPFDMEMERKAPTRGDPSWRRLRADATCEDVEVNHLHIDTGYIRRDLDVALPLRRLRELVDGGEVGSAADSHYSIMGYQGNDSAPLERESAPAIARAMGDEGVQLALLAPV